MNSRAIVFALAIGVLLVLGVQAVAARTQDIEVGHRELPRSLVLIQSKATGFAGHDVFTRLLLRPPSEPAFEEIAACSGLRCSSLHRYNEPGVYFYRAAVIDAHTGAILSETSGTDWFHI